MASIDGSFGEGGGQVLRTAVGLSLLTGEPVHITDIRARRKQPGLRPQHLTSVRAAQQVGQAELSGDAIGSRELAFRPTVRQPGSYRFDVGTAGSATLVLQTVLPALLTADAPSEIELSGGTHNPLAPPVDFLEHAFAPLLARLGPKLDIRLERYGFYPSGGGRVVVRISPTPKLARFDLHERGRKRRVWAKAVVSRLPISIAEREANVVRRKLNLRKEDLIAEEVESPGPGNTVMIFAEFEQVCEVFTGFGKRGLPAERVAAMAAKEANQYLKHTAPVGPHLADQLLIPLALAGGSFRTMPPTEHTRTNAAVIERFLNVRIEFEPLDGAVWQVSARQGS